MFNIYNGRKHISDNKYMLYSRKCTDESIKKTVSRIIEREKTQKFNLVNLSGSQIANNNLIANQSAFVFFLSISSLMYYFLNNKYI